MTVRAVRLPLSLLVELIWSFAAVAVLVAVLGRGDGPSPSILGVGAVVVGSFALARALQQTELEDAQFRTLGAATSVLAIAAIVYLEYGRGSPPWDIGWVRTLATDAGRPRSRDRRDRRADGVVDARHRAWPANGGIRWRDRRASRWASFPSPSLPALRRMCTGPNVFGLLAIVYLLARARAYSRCTRRPTPTGRCGRSPRSGARLRRRAGCRGRAHRRCGSDRSRRARRPCACRRARRIRSLLALTYCDRPAARARSAGCSASSRCRIVNRISRCSRRRAPTLRARRGPERCADVGPRARMGARRECGDADRRRSDCGAVVPLPALRQAQGG